MDAEALVVRVLEHLLVVGMFLLLLVNGIE
jgi:hypothetical protein